MNARHALLVKISTAAIKNAFLSTYHILEKIYDTLHHSFVTTTKISQQQFSYK